MYVRDPKAARAAAIRRQVQAFKNSGEEMPQHLKDLLADIDGDAKDETVDLVDHVTGQVLAEVEVSKTPPVHRSPTYSSDLQQAREDAEAGQGIPGPTGSELEGLVDPMELQQLAEVAEEVNAAPAPEPEPEPEPVVEAAPEPPVEDIPVETPEEKALEPEVPEEKAVEPETPEVSEPKPETPAIKPEAEDKYQPGPLPRKRAPRRRTT
jgi:hypothetical protein